jgi:hypothetical protein
VGEGQWVRVGRAYVLLAYAARGGHLEVLQWARANGCEWDEYTCSDAARGGHLEVLQWARANGCEWDEGTCACAADGGRLEAAVGEDQRLPVRLPVGQGRGPHFAGAQRERPGP